MKIGREPIVTSCPQAPPYRVRIPSAPVDRRHSSAPVLLGSPDSEKALASAVSLQFRRPPAGAMFFDEGMPGLAPLHVMPTAILKSYRTYADGGERVLGYGPLRLGRYASGAATHEPASVAVEFRRTRSLWRWSHCTSINGHSSVQIKLAMRRRAISPLVSVERETVRRPIAGLAARGGPAVTGCPMDIIGVAALQGAWRFPVTSPSPAKRSADAARLHRVPTLP